jgi:hypothetical protein
MIGSAVSNFVAAVVARSFLKLLTNIEENQARGTVWNMNWYLGLEYGE